MTRRGKQAAAFFAALGAVMVAGAAPLLALDSTPGLIKVQGFLSDRSGGAPVPADGPHLMTFELYDAAVDGTLLASIGPVTVEVSAGLYEVALPIPGAALDGSERYLQIEVGGETLSPRVRLGSAPFAYQADRVDGFEGADLEESAEIAGAVAGHAAAPDAHREHASLEESAEITAAVAAHGASPDAHPQYVRRDGDTMTGGLAVAGPIETGSGVVFPDGTIQLSASAGSNAAVGDTTLIYPPPNGCRLVVGGVAAPFPPGPPQPGTTSSGWPTATVALSPAESAGEDIQLIVRDPDPAGTRYAESDTLTIQTGIVSLNLASVNPLPTTRRTEVLYEVLVAGVPVAASACTAVNADVLDRALIAVCSQAEICDGIDNDCNGLVDDNVLIPELCDGFDNDCDGLVDEGSLCADDGNVCTVETCEGIQGCASTPLPDETPTGPTCGIGGCERPAVCLGGQESCTPGVPEFDICDGVDNDCDGDVDEDGVCDGHYAGSLSKSDGSWDYQGIPGVLGAELECQAQFGAQAGLCTYPQMQAAVATGDLVNAFDVGGIPIGSFWMYLPEAPDTVQCLGWTETSGIYDGSYSILDRSSGELSQVTTGLCTTTRSVACCVP